MDNVQIANVNYVINILSSRCKYYEDKCNELTQRMAQVIAANVRLEKRHQETKAMREDDS